MAKRELSFCYFNDLPEKPEVVTCNECGFTVSYKDKDAVRIAACRYAMCPFASPEECQKCDYMEFSSESGVGRCMAPASMLDRYQSLRRR